MPTLDWLDRQAAFSVATQTTTHVLRPHAAGHVFGDAAAAKDNLLIQGDNLQALKALLPFYRGQVKCIFIDPPYNTKSAFEHYDDNLEHSQWLSMMLPRLQVLRDLLSEDGSIWVTIDDNEGHYLKVLMDEVFGRGNFVATSIWQKKYAPKADSKYFSESHDFVLCYARQLASFNLGRIQKGEKQTSRYTNRDNDPRGPWKASDVLRNEARDYAIFPVRLPSGREVLPPSGTSWRYTKEKFAELIADNRIWFGVDGDARPAYKRFLSEVTETMPATTIWTYDDVGHNDESKKEMRALFDTNLFGTPKPERLLARIVDLATNPGDLVLDSFLGSGTTAAVAHKMGRRWIGIEMGEHATTHCMPRLQKVIAGEQGGISTAVGWQGGGGFQLLQLGAPLFDELGDIHPEVRFADLAAFIWMRETGTALPAQAANGPLPLLGVYEGTAYYLLFNGILGDRRPASGNVLTTAVLQALNELCGHDGPKVIYGEACRLGDARLKAEDISFKQLPHAVPR